MLIGLHEPTSRNFIPSISILFIRLIYTEVRIFAMKL